MKTQTTNITDNQRLVSVTNRFGRQLPIYDDGFGPLWIHRNSMGISGIVRAPTLATAYYICEDEIFPSADDEAFEKDWDDMTRHEKACWDEAYGYRPNGRGGPTPEKDRGIYAKDLNGDYLDRLTDELAAELELTLEIEDWE